MKKERSALSTIYYSDNGQFSSRSKGAVELFEKQGVDIGDADHANINLWNCKGEIHWDKVNENLNGDNNEQT